MMRNDMWRLDLVSDGYFLYMIACETDGTYESKRK